MNNLWTFGDSLTASFNELNSWSNKYISWKGYKPDVYGDIISKTLGLNLNNLGVGSSDNYSIFQSFCDVSNKIKEGDLLIFGWSSPIRFRMVTNNKKWCSVLPSTDVSYFNKMENVSTNALTEILLNRDNLLYIEEVNSWVKMINNSFKNFNIIHWNAFDNRISSIYVSGLETIKDETNNEIIDKHFSEGGQKRLSEILLNYYHSDRKYKII
jgi:hypothetical protein